MAESVNTTRRSFLSMAPKGLALAAVTYAALPTLKTPQERIDEHLKGISEAWAEIFGDAPRVCEANYSSRFVLVAGKPSDQLS